MFRGGKGKVSWCVVPEACSHAEQTSWSGLEGLFFYIFFGSQYLIGQCRHSKGSTNTVPKDCGELLEVQFLFVVTAPFAYDAMAAVRECILSHEWPCAPY